MKFFDRVSFNVEDSIKVMDDLCTKIVLDIIRKSSCQNGSESDSDDHK